MVARVVILGGIVFLVGVDFLTIYATKHDVVEAMRELPRAGVASAIIGALAFWGADVGIGPITASFVLLIAASYLLYAWPTLAGLLNTSYQAASGSTKTIVTGGKS